MFKDEKAIEQTLLNQLKELKYTYRPDICDRATLEQNFRQKFEALNHVRLTEAEFARLRDQLITSDPFQAAQTLRETGYFQREDNTPLHYTLVNLKDWCKNDYEVVNQLRINTTNSHHRYDVILLINGLPVVQIELKTLQTSPRRAMEQIVGYKNDPGNGYTNSLLCFMQLFIASNGSNTYYFANNAAQHFAFDADERFLPIYQLADENNTKITSLHEFTKVFLSKCTLGETLSRYMVLVASEKRLMMMRPYQIYAVKAIVDCIEQNRGNGYIWHTTGSGKTLTSFKAATLLKDNLEIEKCLFVVDRKDLDRQTREEFNKFQEDSVEENTNTEALVRRLLSEDYADKVIVTTIQKLGLALSEPTQKGNGRISFKERLEPLRHKRMVFIFDECHRSQFGQNHDAIKQFFPNAQLFGFTGTPIFEQNATYKQIDGTDASYKTTADIFEKLLHAYTITHAIEDRNVLRFHIDYFQATADVSASAAQDESVRQRAVVESILDKHDAATNQRRFNALLATASINSAISYYRLFQQVQAEHQAADPNFRPLHIACVFSPPAEGNPDARQLQEDLPQEKADNQQQPEQKKAALQQILADYNQQYGTNHTIGEFDLYYQDVQKRIKDQQYPNADYAYQHKIDIVIVVDMLLTGFDSKYLNTLYVDKNLKHHGLIQAFSRTNRVLNDTKPYGNIRDFRNQGQAVDEAIALFSGEDGEKAKTMWLVEPASDVLAEYEKAVLALQQVIGPVAPEEGMLREAQAVYNLKGDTARLAFLKQFKEVQRLRTQLGQYTDLSEAQEEQVEAILPEDALRSLRSSYLDMAQEFRARQGKADAGEDTVQQQIEQLDFEFVLFSSAVIDYDYIMKLLANFSAGGGGKAATSREQLVSLLASTSNLMDEREEIVAYVNTLQAGAGLTEQQIRDGYQAFKATQLEDKLQALADQYQVDPAALKNLVTTTLGRMVFDAQQLSDLLAPLQLGWKQRGRVEKALVNELRPLLQKQAQGATIAGLAAYES